MKYAIARAVAETVMGGFISDPDAMADVGDVWYWLHPKQGVLRGEPYKVGVMKRYDHDWHDWKPETDMAAAWQIVERLGALGWRVGLNQSPDGSWNCRFCPEDTSAYVYAVDQTPMLAICSAALKVSVDQGGNAG